jgi:hypothetical protein
MSPLPSVDPMASSTLRHSLLWALCFSPIALGLPGPSIINRAGGRTENAQSFHDSAELEQGSALEGRRTVLDRAAAIVSLHSETTRLTCIMSLPTLSPKRCWYDSLTYAFLYLQSYSFIIPPFTPASRSSTDRISRRLAIHQSQASHIQGATAMPVMNSQLHHCIF